MTPQLPEGVTLEALGDGALLLRLGRTIDAATNARVQALARSVATQRPAWLRDVVPAYASLALHLDTEAFDTGRDPLQDAGRWLAQRLAASPSAPIDAAGRTIEIAVRYGGEHGPDLDDVAVHAGLSPREVISRHVAANYRVAMLGFAPGFPYLLGLDPALATPRLAQPRLTLPAGSVAIGGAQTGIYPRPGPGGWRVIGRTDAVLFDPQRNPPALLHPGDRVRFVAQQAPA